jgi:preprotein translocase subunit SecD
VARSGNLSRPGRSLLGLIGLLVLIYGLVGIGSVTDAKKAGWTPKLALDLEGGTEIILTPVLTDGSSKAPDQTTLNEAVKIIRQRVNGSGVSEAEVNTQGSNNIVVSLPGKPDPATITLVESAAQLQFRAVLAAGAGSPQAQPTATGTPTTAPSGSAPATPSGSVAPSASPTGPAVSAPPATPSSNGRALPPAAVRQAGRAAAPSGTPSVAVTPGAVTPGAVNTVPGTPAQGTAATPAAGATPTAKPTDASDVNWITPDVQAKFVALDCSNAAQKKKLTGNGGGDLTKPYVTCSDDGTVKYVLGPAEVLGKDVKSALAGIQQNSQGALTGEWEVQLKFTGEGAKKFAKVTTRLFAIPQTEARNQFAIVLDGLVISAPQTLGAITGGDAQITGNFSQATAQSLANQLKYGALPVSFRVQTEDQISALLGSEQLKRGLLAGLIGLILVVIYSLLQYRLLGLVTVASLVVAGAVTYGMVLLLGWRQGYRLSLPGVAGLIVAIGITADSFIVYFERVRDEVRDGRALLTAVEVGWERARRTIMASDAVSLIAAVVLYVLAVGGVRGFAFTLGLTTVVDVAVVFLFTKPLVALLARTEFFGGGHKLSGFDPEHLGRTVTYTGRGGVRPPAARAATGQAPAAAGTGSIAERKSGQSIAARKAAAAAETTSDTPAEQTAGSGRDA